MVSLPHHDSEPTDTSFDDEDPRGTVVTVRHQPTADDTEPSPRELQPDQ